MKQTLIIIGLILSTKVLLADYTPKELYEMIIKADKIVYGEIIDLDSTNFTLRIDGSLTGDKGTLRVKRFENWPCAHRWTSYDIGQELFIFLTFQNGQLYSMSGGNEGELPIQEDSVYVSGFSLRISPPPPRPGNKHDSTLYSNYFDKEVFLVKHHSLNGSVYWGQPFSKNDFINSVKKVRECFDFDYGEYNSVNDAKIFCPDSIITDKIENDKIFRWTSQELKNN